MEIGPVDAGLDGAYDDALELPCSARLDQLAAERTQQALRHRRNPQLPHSLKARNRLADERVAREAAQELRVVVVDCEHEPQSLEALLARGAQHQPSVQRLPCGRNLD